MIDFIENEYLLPCLEIGMQEDVFWNKTPKQLTIYFKAYNNIKEKEVKRWSQQMWEMGLYVKAAIATSVFPVGLYDCKHKLGDYPKCPHINFENTTNEQDEQWVKNERLRCEMFFKSFGKK